LSNSAQALTFTADSNPGNNIGTTTGTFFPEADLQITKTGPATVLSGNNLTYTITVTNNGPSDAFTVFGQDPLPTGTTFVSMTQNSGPSFNITVANTGAADALLLQVADTIPANTTFVSLTQTSGTAFDFISPAPIGGVVSMSTGTFAAGEIATFSLVVKVDSGVTGGTISNTAQVTSTTPDSDPSNNSSTATTEITQCDVQVTKSGPTSVNAGEDIAYTITFFNAGPDAATNVVISDSIGLFRSFVSLTQNASGSGFTTSTPAVGSNGTVTISTPSLPLGGVATFTLVVHVSPVLTGGSIDNTASATSTTPDTDPSDNSSMVTTSITTQADLSVAKDGPATVIAGQNLTYTLTVTNTGPSYALDVAVNDALPAGTTFVSLTQNSGPAFTPTTPPVGSNGTVTLTLDSMPDGASATFTLIVNVGRGVFGTLDNTATGGTSTTDSDPTNNSSTASTTVTPLQLFAVGEGKGAQGRVRVYYAGDQPPARCLYSTPRTTAAVVARCRPSFSEPW
jgi:uncharacterized repeat protein (TIGR01451 family)